MFGSGLEITCVVATRTIVKWFKGYELALAMAINVGIARLGSALGIAVSPDIATATCHCSDLCCNSYWFGVDSVSGLYLL